MVHYNDEDVPDIPNGSDSLLPASLAEDCERCNHVLRFKAEDARWKKERKKELKAAEKEEERKRKRLRKEDKQRSKELEKEANDAIGRRSASFLTAANNNWTAQPAVVVLPHYINVDDSQYCKAAAPVVNGSVLDFDAFMSLQQQPLMEWKCAAPQTRTASSTDNTISNGDILLVLLGCFVLAAFVFEVANFLWWCCAGYFGDVGGVEHEVRMRAVEEGEKIVVEVDDEKLNVGNQ